MDVSFPILMDIYDYLLMIKRKKLIMSFNEEYLDRELKYDIIKRYKLWLSNKSPILVDNLRLPSNDLINMLNTYEKLCCPNRINKDGDTDLMIVCKSSEGHFYDPMYSFALNPSEYQPSGSVFASRIDDMRHYQPSGSSNWSRMNETTLDISRMHKTILDIQNNSLSHKIAIKMMDILGNDCLPQHMNNSGDTVLTIANNYTLEVVATKIVKMFGYP